MIRVRNLALATLATALAAVGCTSVTVPSIPPLPSFPSDFTMPPIEIPSGIELPSGDPSAASCQLVTPAEMSTIMGAQVTVSASDETSCTYTLPNFSAVVVTTSSDTDLTGVRFLLGESAQDVTIGGLPAVRGLALGQPAVYVQKPTGQLSILGVLTGDDSAAVDRMVQVANMAVPRWQ